MMRLITNNLALFVTIVFRKVDLPMVFNNFLFNFSQKNTFETFLTLLL